MKAKKGTSMSTRDSHRDSVEVAQFASKLNENCRTSCTSDFYSSQLSVWLDQELEQLEEEYRDFFTRNSIISSIG